MGNGNKDSSGMPMHRIRSSSLIRFFVIALIFLIFLSAFCITEQKQAEKGSEKAETGKEGYAKDALVSPSWLKEHLNDENVRIIELSYKKEDYDSGHIKNAAYIDWRRDIVDENEIERYTIAPKEKIEELLRNLGVRKSDIIVLYDNLDNRLAARAYWVLKYYGHENVKILNGGKKAWLQAIGELTKEVPSFEESDYRIEKINEEYIVYADFILENLENENFVLVDGRPKEQYTGEVAGKVFNTGEEHKRRGHIPGAINIPWKDNLKEDGTFKSYEELKKLYESKGVTRDKTVITYCNEGLHAAMPWFVLHELLGYENVRLYDNSMSEWANDERFPVKTGEEA